MNAFSLQQHRRTKKNASVMRKWKDFVQRLGNFVPWF